MEFGEFWECWASGDKGLRELSVLRSSEFRESRGGCLICKRSLDPK